MSKRDWWLGISAVVLAVLIHATFPRYVWRHTPDGALMRIDRWTGESVLGRWQHAANGGRWWVAP